MLSNIHISHVSHSSYKNTKLNLITGLPIKNKDYNSNNSLEKSWKKI